MDPMDDEQFQLKFKQGKVCGICGDKALGFNFNAITCEACKAFFRRNALRTKQDFKCPFDGNCNIDLVTRRFCQRCRLKKCFDIGMKKEWILSEDEKKTKREKIVQNRKKRTHKSLSCDMDKDSQYDGNEYSNDSYSCNGSSPDTNGKEGTDSLSYFDSQSYLNYFANKQLKIAASPGTLPTKQLLSPQRPLPPLQSPPISDENLLYLPPSNSVTSKTYTTLPSVPNSLSPVPNCSTTNQKFPELPSVNSSESYPNNAYTVEKLTPSSNYAVPVTSVNQLCPSNGSEYHWQVASPDKNSSSYSAPRRCYSDASQLEKKVPSFNGIGNSLTNASQYLYNYNQNSFYNQDDGTSLDGYNPESQSDPQTNRVNVFNCSSLTSFTDACSQIDVESYSKDSTDIVPVYTSQRSDGAPFVEISINSNNFTFMEQLIFNELIEAGQSLGLGSCRSVTREVTKLSEMFELMKNITQRSIVMAQMLSTFQELCEQDRATVLQDSIYEIMILQSVTAFVPENDMWSYPIDQTCDSALVLKFETFKNFKYSPGDLFYDEIKAFIYSFFPEWVRDSKLMFLLITLVLFKPTRFNMKHNKIIHLKYMTYHYLFKKYIQLKYPLVDEAKLHMNKMITLLNQLPSLKDKYMKRYDFKVA